VVYSHHGDGESNREWRERRRKKSGEVGEARAGEYRRLSRGRGSMRGRELLRTLAWLGLPLLVGAALRLYGLDTQVLGGDEQHACHVACHIRILDILTTYREADNCIPLSAFFRTLLWADFKLWEMPLRLPIVLSGLLLIVMGPLWLRPRIGRVAAGFLAWLLAISPVLVTYSGIVRSYMPVALLGLLAFASFDAWWRGGRAWRGGVYVLSASLAVWFHLGAAPFVLAPPVYALASLLARRGHGRNLKALGLLGLGLALGLALVIVPPLDSLLELVGDKRQVQQVGPQAVIDVLLVHAGTTRIPVAVLFWGTALLGLGLAFRRMPQFAWYSLAVVFLHAVGLRALSPKGLSAPLMMNRYLIILLPVVLSWAALGLAAIWHTLGGRKEATAVAAILLAALFASGPLAEGSYWRNSFRFHNDFVAFASIEPVESGEHTPEFYRRLGREPGEGPGKGPGKGTVLEYPWSTTWMHVSSLPAYQAVHGRRVMVSPVEGLPGSGLIAWHNIVGNEPEELVASGARWLVLHRNLGAEELRLVGKRAAKYTTPDRYKIWMRMRVGAKALEKRLMLEWPTPVYTDDDILVWDLERVREH